jgi:hypothetical protein
MHVINHYTSTPDIISVLLERWAARTRRRGEASLAEDLLHAIILLVEIVVHLGHVLDADTVGNHLERVDLILLDLVEQVVPVHVHGSLAVADETDAALHQRTCFGLAGKSCCSDLSICLPMLKWLVYPT